MDILVYDPYIKDCPDYVKITTLPDLMKASMFITLHSRLTSENQRFINRELLSMMRDDAYLINTARSGLIDEAALYEALFEKRIAGAALDVFDVEPPTADYPLVKLDNVTVTPHLAGGNSGCISSFACDAGRGNDQDFKSYLFEKYHKSNCFSREMAGIKWT